jgi:hypothetical protein
MTAKKAKRSLKKGKKIQSTKPLTAWKLEHKGG